MKILYFSLDYTPHDHRFLSAMSESEHEVFYVRLQLGPRQTESRPVPPKVEQVKWEGGHDLFRWRDLPKYVMGLRRVIRRIKPDLIHAGPIQTCAFIAVLAGFRPILTMSWGFDLMNDVHRNRWWEWVTRFTLRRSTFFTSDAEVTRDKAVAYGMNPDRTVVFPWGVDLTHFTPHPAPGASRESFTFFCNRSWEPVYGVDVVVKAFIAVARQRDDVNLMLVGGGSQGGMLRALIERAGVGDRVSMPGQIKNTDLPRYYHMADLYISASHVDGSSVSLMEALACGLPCLVSDIPANKEWVREGENGWLFGDGSVDELAAKMLNAIAQRERLPELGCNARATAEAKANWHKNAQTLLDTYQRVVTL